MTVQNEAAHLLCIGLNHQTASVDQRERFANISNEHSATGVLKLASVSECVLLSTCNRIEWYLAVHEDVEHIIPRFCATLGELSGQSVEAVCGSITYYEGPEAIRHIFSVAAGLESMVVGESEILGQISRAYMHAIDDGTLGPVLDALFRGAIRTGKRVRSETNLGNYPASLSSVALDLAAKELGDLSQQNILVIGMGEMGLLTLKLLRGQGAQNVVLMNRTLERARSHAHPNWSVRPMDELPSALADADLVISATSAPQPIITVQDMEKASESRNASPVPSCGAMPLVVIDLAVPRDVEPEVSALDCIALYNLDGLKTAVNLALSKREAAIPAAMEIVAEEERTLQTKLRELEVRPLVVEFRSRAEMIREQELARTLRYLGDVEPETVTHLQHLTRALVNKLLHVPTVRIKEMAQDDRCDEYLSTVCDLLDLDRTTTPL